MPALDGATGWLNSEPLGPADLRGHAVLVNFWTLTCINWLRQEPYVRAWSRAYRGDGLVVVGVHTPEFSFEHEIDRVERATTDREIDYPVAVDDDYAVWQAFDNHYWPALYFVDADGIVRDEHFGEGATRNPSAPSSGCWASSATPSPSPAPAWRRRPTGTTCARPRHTSATRAASAARPRTKPLRVNHWSLAGDGRAGDEDVRLRDGRREHRVPLPRPRRAPRALDAQRRPIPFRVAPRRGAAGTVARRRRRRGRHRRPHDGRLYQLVRQHGRSVRAPWRSSSDEPGAEAYAFTFG
jgi:hypothetical protein